MSSNCSIVTRPETIMEVEDDLKDKVSSPSRCCPPPHLLVRIVVHSHLLTDGRAVPLRIVVRLRVGGLSKSQPSRTAGLFHVCPCLSTGFVWSREAMQGNDMQ